MTTIDTLLGDITRIDFNVPVPETAYGAILRATVPGSSATAPVLLVDPGGMFIEVFDPNLEVAEIVSDGGEVVIFENHIGSFSGGANTGGTWTGVNYQSANDVTELQHIGETFDAYMQGWSVQIDARLPVYFEITGVSGDTITVAGNVTGLVTPDETEFTIIHPPGADPQTGATQTDPCTPESRYIWGGGLYLPPIAGFYVGGTTQGSQPGHNMAGQHYMWNRVYDINIGRWTTPDPAATPWWNPQDHVRNSPARLSDPTGLYSVEIDGKPYKGKGNNEWCVTIKICADPNTEELFVLAMDRTIRKIWPITITSYKVVDVDWFLNPNDVLCEDDFTLIDRLAGKGEDVVFKGGAVEKAGKHKGKKCWTAKFCKELDFSNCGEDEPDIRFELTLKIKFPKSHKNDSKDVRKVLKDAKQNAGKRVKLTSLDTTTETHDLESEELEDADIS